MTDELADSLDAELKSVRARIDEQKRLPPTLLFPLDQVIE